MRCGGGLAGVLVGLDDASDLGGGIIEIARALAGLVAGGVGFAAVGVVLPRFVGVTLPDEAGILLVGVALP